MLQEQVLTIRERTIQNPSKDNLNKYAEFLVSIGVEESKVCKQMKEDCPSIPIWRFTKFLESRYKDENQRHNALSKFKKIEPSIEWDSSEQVDDYFLTMLQLENF